MSAVKVAIPRLYPLQEKIMQKIKTYRFSILMCGRRTGKTVMILRVVSAALRGQVVYLFAPEFSTVANTWDTIVDSLGKAAKKIDKTTRIITFHPAVEGGPCGEFRVIGLHSVGQRDKGRGAAIDIAIYEETQSIDSDILQYHWENAIRPTLADRKGIAIFVGTPPNSKKHYFAKLYCKGALNNPNAQGLDVPMAEHISDNDEHSANYISIRKTAYDNPYIDNQELEDIKREHPPLVFEQEFLARFVEYTARPFVVAFEQQEHEDRVFSRNVAPNPALPFYISFDFNLGAMAATIWQKDHANNYIVCLAEFGCNPNEKVSIQYTTDLIRAWFWDKLGIKIGNWSSGAPIEPPAHLQIYITGDATGTQADPRQRNARTFYQIIVRELGLERRKGVLRVPAANPHHSNSWAQINTWLAMHKQLFISPTCARLRRDMKVTQVTEDRGIDKKSHDPHWLDTLRYFFNAFLPSKYDGQGRV